MPKVKPLDQISKKWIRQSSTAAPEYEAGIKNPKSSWSKATQNAEAAYERGVQASIANKRFSKGVAAAGDSKWQRNALAKGPQRWQQGIELGQAAFEKGFAPYRAVLEGLTLPERGPKGDPKNIRRVEIIAKALHEHKLQTGA